MVAKLIFIVIYLKRQNCPSSTFLVISQTFEPYHVQMGHFLTLTHPTDPGLAISFSTRPPSDSIKNPEVSLALPTSSLSKINLKTICFFSHLLPCLSSGSLYFSTRLLQPPPNGSPHFQSCHSQSLKQIKQYLHSIFQILWGFYNTLFLILAH